MNVPEREAWSVCMCTLTLNSKHWFPASFLLKSVCRKERLRVCVCTLTLNSKHWFPASFLFRPVCRKERLVGGCSDPKLQALFPASFLLRSMCRKERLGVCVYSDPKLQALVSGILLPKRKGTGKRCLECRCQPLVCWSL